MAPLGLVLLLLACSRSCHAALYGKSDAVVMLDDSNFDAVVGKADGVAVVSDYGGQLHKSEEASRRSALRLSSMLLGAVTARLWPHSIRKWRRTSRCGHVCQTVFPVQIIVRVRVPSYNFEFAGLGSRGCDRL
jgi:hypothetical protein